MIIDEISTGYTERQLESWGIPNLPVPTQSLLRYENLLIRGMS